MSGDGDGDSKKKERGGKIFQSYPTKRANASNTVISKNRNVDSTAVLGFVLY